MPEQTKSLDMLMGELLIEARQQTALMQQVVNNQLLLIKALSEEAEDSDVPATYMDGRPIR